MNVPVIRLEFETMKHSLKVALAQRMVELDSDIRAAIDSYCVPERIQALINEEVGVAVNAAVKEEVQNLFRYNAHGRLAIKEAIKQFADDHWSNRDDV